jgi:hypothetical protein
VVKNLALNIGLVLRLVFRAQVEDSGFTRTAFDLVHRLQRNEFAAAFAVLHDAADGELVAEGNN